MNNSLEMFLKGHGILRFQVIELQNIGLLIGRRKKRTLKTLT